jgi:hypothetical protein
MSYRDSPFITVVRLSPGDELGATMATLRSWLDRQKIQPATFITAVSAGTYTFTIGFRSDQDADRFRAQFGA